MKVCKVLDVGDGDLRLLVEEIHKYRSMDDKSTDLCHTQLNNIKAEIRELIHEGFLLGVNSNG